MRILKTFVLEKTYPGSPPLGEKVIEATTTSGNTKNYMLISSITSSLKTYPKEEIENFPEFWKLQQASF